MPDFDLSRMSAAELTELQAGIEEIIAAKKTEAHDRLFADMKAVVEEAGYSFEEIAADGAGGGKRGRPAGNGRGRKLPATPRFAHPGEPELTWTGRGRKPNWLVAELSAGADIDDFRL